MDTVETAAKAAGELAQTLAKINPAEADALMHEILAAKTVFLAGAGRSLLMLRAFAMRLMHIGFTVHLVGDTVTPALREGDLLVIGSGSGETGGLVNMAKKVKQLKGRLAVISIFPESTLGKMADVVVRIPAYTDKLPESADNRRGTLPGGSMFEQGILLLGDSMILPLSEKTGTPTDRAFDRHANLE